jgi:phospholipid/cholesterol/gamma-HCH transport system substrate-binding protein
VTEQVKRSHRLGMRGFALGVTAMVLTSCGWKGIANVPLDIGPGSEKGSQTFYVQIPDTLALNTNSRVRVADVFVGTVK